MELRLLGPLEVVVDGHPVALPGGRIRSLLALLGLHPQQVLPADRLIDELWSGDPPPTAGTALQNLVSKLRKLLEPDRSPGDSPTVLVTHAPGYVLAVDPELIDTHRFRWLVEDAMEEERPRERADRLRRALALWRGQALADFTYEPFAQTPIAALDELRVTALEARIGADLELGHHVEVIAELDELVAAHPLREELRAQLMLALYRSGRQTEALDVYRSTRRQLVDELGMEPGPRLRALEQAVIAQDPALDAPEPAQVVAPRPENGDAWLGSGRRMVTVWFADLAPVATAASADADPEAVRPLVHRTHATAREVVEQHGGRVEGIIGDVAVAVFGLPVAHEDDPLRAVHAATTLQARLEELASNAEHDAGTARAVRVGIATGEIVFGDVAAAGASGPTAGSASQLQQAARSGEVLLAETTRRLVEGPVVLEPVDGPVDTTLDGPVWRLVDVVTAPSSPPLAGTSLVGRMDELIRLRRELDDAVRRERAGLVTVVGEAGVVKSRLAQAFADSVAGEARVETGHCRAYGAGISFWPLRELIQDLTDRTGQAGLEQLLAAEPHGPSHARLIGTATSLTDEPLRDHGDLFVAVRQLLEVTARRQPLVVLVEDVHWAQPTFLDLLAYLAESVRAAVLLLCLARPEIAGVWPRWETAVAASTRIELQPLGSADSRRLVVERLGGHHLAPETMGQIQAMGQGNPLFLEQLLATVREDRGTGRELEVPPTIQALLTARLDRLGPAERDLLRCASVIGVDVRLDAVQALVPDEAQVHVDSHLQALHDRQLVRRPSSHHGAAGFDFRHVLIQQAAYHTLTHAARAELHERLAEWVSTRSGVAVAEAEELGGLHLEQAVRHRHDMGRTDASTQQLAVRAGEQLAAAGLRAYGRFDVPGAENLLSRARILLPPDHPRRPPVLRRLTEAYPVMGRPEDAADCFEELLELVEHGGDDRAAQGVRLEQLRFNMIIGPDPIPMAAIQQQVEDALAEFEREGDEIGASQAHYLLGSVHLRAGRMAELAEVAWRGIGRARRTADLRERLGAPWWVVFHLLHGPTTVAECLRSCQEVMDVGGLNHLGVVAASGHFRAMAGEVDEGRRLVVRARELLRERIRLPRPLAFIEERRAGVELLAGDHAAAAAALEEALRVALWIAERDQAAQIAGHASLLQARRGEAEEAARLASLAAEQAPAESVIAQALARAAEGRAGAEKPDRRRAERLVRQTIAGVPDDLLPLRALLHETLAEVLELAGNDAGAVAARAQAAALHARKGNLVAARRVTP